MVDGEGGGQEGLAFDCNGQERLREEFPMRRIPLLGLAVLAVAAVAVSTAWAGNPHFVSVDATRTGDSVTVTGKEAGLGDESQIHIVVTATAECINPGAHHPKAANKESVSSSGDVPVQNGKADFSLTLTATISPSCSPPMTLVFTDITVEDTTNGISSSLSGTF
jgi:hypothetical protein